MPRKPQPLAKLSRPRLYDALPRERLFALLDQKRRHPLVWISGPPGSGKTTLIASYLASRKPRTAWYQADPEDNDLPTFFHFLGEACLRSSAKRFLPSLHRERLGDYAAYARKYFRQLFLKFDGVVVLDNFQEVADNSGVLGVLNIAVGEVPQGSTIVVLSRTEPPQDWVRHVAGQDIGHIGWPDLRFSVEETRLVVGATGGTVEQLHARSNGWAAGIVLMKEAPRRNNGKREGTVSDGSAMVFDYFASQILDGMDANERLVALCSAVPPYFTREWLPDIAGLVAAPSIVDDFYRRQLFLNRRDRGTYEYHALFRDFLLEEAKRRLSREEILAISRCCAEFIETSGDVEAAFNMRVAASDWVEARRLLSTNAEHLLARGRWTTLARWLDVLRPEDFDADPWLVYWRGRTVLASDAAAARGVLQDAHARFLRSGSRTGQLQALAEILGSFFLEWDTVQGMDPWIDATKQAILDDRPASEEALNRAYGSLVVALLYRRPQDPMLHAGARLVASRLDTETDATQRLRLAIFIAHYYDIMGEQDKSGHAVHAMETLLAQAEADPLTSVIASMRVAHHCQMKGEIQRSIASATRSIEMAMEHGFSPGVTGFLTICLAHCLLNAGRPEDAARELERARPFINPAQSMILIYMRWCEFWCAALRKDRDLLRALWTQFARIPPAGVPINTAYNLPVIVFLVEEGQHTAAADRIREWKSNLAGMRSPYIDFNLELMEAFLGLRTSDRQTAAVSLRKAFALGAQGGFTNSLAWMPGIMAELCAFALDCGIEPAYARRLIRERGLAPTDSLMESWPWPVRIQALGRFEVFIDGNPLKFSGRPQHRTLELLKIIVALGCAAVNVSRVKSLLWPDAEGDAAQRSFAVTLHRLRKLLGTDRAIVANDGAITLNADCCWVDAIAFESRIEQLSDGQSGDDGEWLLRSYRGHLLADEDMAWALPPRERLRAKFEAAVRRIGQRLEETGEWQAAMDLYRRALDLDALAEPFHRRVMDCLSRQGRHVEAMEAYRRCRQMLSVVLGVAPSADTQALFRSIQAAAAAAPSLPESGIQQP